MNELTIGPGDEASLLGDPDGEHGGGPFTGDFEGEGQKILETGISCFRGTFGNLWSC